MWLSEVVEKYGEILPYNTEHEIQNNLTIVGRVNKSQQAVWLVLKCDICSSDPELFGDGLFVARKGEVVGSKSQPCNCSGSFRFTEDQYIIRVKRIANKKNYTFMGWAEEYKGVQTKIKLKSVNADWEMRLAKFLYTGRGCPVEGRKNTINSVRKPDEEIIQKFMATGVFHQDTKFWRSDRLNNRNDASYWHSYCPVCETLSESFHSNLLKGNVPCKCINPNQVYGYIHVIMDNDIPIAIKFGISSTVGGRIRGQKSKTKFTVVKTHTFKYENKQSCRDAERFCIDNLECGILPKEEFKDGYTETTWVYNLDKIIEIYKSFGGVRIME